MEESPNPTSQVPNPETPASPPVSTGIQTPPVKKPLGSTEPPAKAAKFPLPLIIGILAFFLLAIGAAGFYAFKPQIMSLISKPTPTPTLSPSPTEASAKAGDPTAGWKTYEGDGFAFKYPDSYVLGDSSSESAGLTAEAIRLEKDVEWGLGAYGGLTNNKGSVVNIVVFKNLDISETSLKKTYGNQISIKKISLGSKDGIELKGEFLNERYLYFPMNSGILTIQTGIAELDIQKREIYINEFGQILSTFQFTN